jgi:hypothetical protein
MPRDRKYDKGLARIRLLDRDSREKIFYTRYERVRPQGCVHFRLDESNPTCAVCGQTSTTWFGPGEEKAWEKHPERCVIDMRK